MQSLKERVENAIEFEEPATIQRFFNHNREILRAYPAETLALACSLPPETHSASLMLLLNSLFRVRGLEQLVTLENFNAQVIRFLLSFDQ